ncbi:hypothetical protein GH714_034537 [Hevea brasiliensis]|uniref:FBD domain-containing protein n=1 Tax=Hevea brasiliensis TaxID=3981 RepID=A0A6A6N6S5_HEVBR|nr:hypothetical protein GH714_034537 [Hevea brasiliensis]
MKKVISCVVSRRFQHLHLEANTSFPYALLNCKSIETLDLNSFSTLPLSFASFTMLNSLHLENCSFAVSDQTDELLDPFVSCPNLKNLSLICCNFGSAKSLRISGLQLLSLSLQNGLQNGYCPHLKIEIFAPKLTFFIYHWIGPMVFGEVNFPSLNVVDIAVYRVYPSFDGENANMNLINLFRGFHNVQFVKLHYNTIEVLTFVPGLLEKQLCPFTNLKSLKLCLPNYTKSSKIPFHVMRYLHGDSSGADLIIVKS